LPAHFCYHSQQLGTTLQVNFKQLIVSLILNGQTEKALHLLAENYKVATPKLKVGLPKGHKTKAFGCYTPKNATIFLKNSDIIKNPFIILHEFYHHLRTSIDKKHRGTEKNANKFAREFIETYQSSIVQQN
jgi:Zn-dependent peptidase ImmA (M78 family)